MKIGLRQIITHGQCSDISEIALQFRGEVRKLNWTVLHAVSIRTVHASGKWGYKQYSVGRQPQLFPRIQMIFFSSFIIINDNNINLEKNQRSVCDQPENPRDVHFSPVHYTKNRVIFRNINI